MDEKPLSRRKCLKSKDFREWGIAENATNLHNVDAIYPTFNEKGFTQSSPRRGSAFPRGE